MGAQGRGQESGERTKAMNEILWTAFKEEYGNQCERHKDILEARIAAVVAATLFAGVLGDTPLSRLNRALDEATKAEMKLTKVD